jgi:DNA mismatch repair protein MutS2
MHQKSIATLEYPKIIERVAGETSFSASKELARQLMPSADLNEVERGLAFTGEARRLIDVRPDIGVRGAKDVRPHVLVAQRGGMLSPGELIDVLATLRASAFVSRAISRQDEDSFPLLKSLAIDLPIRPALEGRIAESISEEGEVLDSASPELRRLRADIRSAQSRLQDRLSTLVNEFRSALQEPIITMRSDRYVLPVRAEARSQVRGIVHDQSGSGATVFVEPLVVVEMNNRLRELQLAERQEIERILLDLSEQVAENGAYIRLAVELLAEIDLHLAKARYAGLINASEPKITSAGGKLELHQARHPLLGGNVVPIDFRLGDDFNMVVITGPNTGGKTVALKTVGLLCLMAQSGLHIPVRDDSMVPVYHDIFADIGDEQSIEQSLSTFSSHLNRIIEILREAEPGALVLLDELGAGTDPSEGSALARAILSHLKQREIATIATTHYSELKVFAHEEAGVANASVEFDVDTLSPTYRLSIGLPGRSNALAIATRLGLRDDIIESARGFLGSAGVEMENLLEGLQADRQAVADERYHLSMERAEAEYQRRELERQRIEFEEERDRILNQARTEARNQVESVQSQLAHMRVEMQHPKITPERLGALRAKARALQEATAPIPVQRNRRAGGTTHSGLEDEETPEESATGHQRGPLQIGEMVRVRSMDSRGELVSLPDSRGEAEVQLGPLKMRVQASDLERVSRRQSKAFGGSDGGSMVTLPVLDLAAVPEMQLDVRGRRVEEVLPDVDRYLNDAFLAGMPFVRVLHGKGTGALRQAIREELSRHPLVASFSPAEAKDGGDGITVVKLKSS